MEVVEQEEDADDDGETEDPPASVAPEADTKKNSGKQDVRTPDQPMADDESAEDDDDAMEEDEDNED